MKINTKEEFLIYLKIKLGEPVILNRDITRKQLEICVDEAVSKFQEEAGTEEGFLVIPTSAGISEYKVDENIIAVKEVISISDTVRSGDMTFTFENLYLFPVLLKMGSPEFLTMQMLMDEYENFKLLYGKQTIVRIKDLEHKAEIIPTPISNYYVVCRVFYKIPDIDCYNHIWVKRYALALAKIQLGENRSKYSGITLPGGGSLNGERLISEGKEELEKLETELKEKYSLPLGFRVG